MEKLKNLYDICKKSHSSFLIVLFRAFGYRLRGKLLIVHPNTRIKGLNNIITRDFLLVGLEYTGFTHNNDITYINVNGSMYIEGSFHIGRGCRFDIGKGARVTVNKGSYINPFCNVVIMHRLYIGSNCAISWGCQFLDEDFHFIDYEGKTEKGNEIIIGDNVWIGSFVSIYKGTKVPNGCVVASNSVLKSQFLEENLLIGGNPAKIIKRNITWGARDNKI